MAASVRDQPVLLGSAFSTKGRKMRIKRFCIDITAEREEYEELLNRFVTSGGKDVKVLSEEPIFSQKDNTYYVVMKWQEPG